MSLILEIERDIIFNDISDYDIKKRIQDDIIGYEIGEWLTNRISDVKDKAASLINHVDTLETFCNDYSNLDPSLKHERKGRVEDFLSSLELRYSEYTSESEKLRKWIRSVVSAMNKKHDKKVIIILQGFSDELFKISEESGVKVNVATAKIRSIIENDIL